MLLKELEVLKIKYFTAFQKNDDSSILKQCNVYITLYYVLLIQL